MRKALATFPRNLVASYRGRYLYAHGIAIAVTVVIVLSGFDWWYFEHTRAYIIQYVAVFAGPLGFFVPLLVPLVMLLVGTFRRRPDLSATAWFVAQAEAISWLVTSFYKVFTGRTQPEFLTHLGTTDISRDFHFGILQHGIFWGWPSSHAAAACSMAAALFVLFPNSRAARSVAPLYAAYITLSASMSFHWFSDSLAGALIGSAIGLSVAHAFNRMNAE